VAVEEWLGYVWINITPYPRSNIFVVFNSVDNRLAAPFAAPKPRPGYLAARSD
jgi:ectoine hydroxylase